MVSIGVASCFQEILKLLAMWDSGRCCTPWISRGIFRIGQLRDALGEELACRRRYGLLYVKGRSSANGQSGIKYRAEQ